MVRDRPNILIVTCHDLGRFLGCYGVPTVRTPRFDGFAAEGVRFGSAFCTAPQCSPSRSSLFTGRYPHANGVMGLTHGAFGWDLHPEERHVAQVLGAAGYTTVLVGLHHEAREVQRCGYDEVLPQAHGDEVARMAIETAARLAQGDRPFYLQVGFHEPHRVGGAGDDGAMGFVGGYIEPDDELGVSVPPYLHDTPDARREVAELQGAVRYLDAAFGQLLDGIARHGLAERTLVLFTTDHGVAFPRAKCSLYDPGIEVSLLARYPARGWSGGRVVDGLVSNVDVFATLLDAAGIPVPENGHGRSLAELLDGSTTVHRDAIFAEMTYHDYYHPQRCVRTADHKLTVNFSTAPSFMDPSQSWVRRTRPVVPANPAVAFTPAVELYDLLADPLEWHNLADDPAQGAVRAELLARLARWMRETGDPLLDGAVTSPRHHEAVAALTGSA